MVLYGRKVSPAMLSETIYVRQNTVIDGVTLAADPCGFPGAGVSRFFDPSDIGDSSYWLFAWLCLILPR